MATARANRDRTRLHPELRAKLERLEAVMAAAGHPIFLTEGVRFRARQAQLYAQGRMLRAEGDKLVAAPTRTPGPIVTHAKPGQSDHQPDAAGYGRAADVAFKAKPHWSEDHPWDLLGAAAKAIGLKWGGDWKGRKRDRPHIYVEV